MVESAALMEPARGARKSDYECRAAVRHACSIQATSQPLDEVETLSWGAVVDNLSAGGVSLTLCFPFRLGTYLAVDLRFTSGQARTSLVRVVHVGDNADGTWHLGCEFVKPLTNSEVEMMI